MISNLLISHVELRSEDSPDIQPYTHDRKVDKYVVPLGDDIVRVKNAYLKVCKLSLTFHKIILNFSFTHLHIRVNFDCTFAFLKYFK